MASKRKSTLDQITEILKPAPEIGSDDDLDFDTRAKVIDFEDEFSEDDKPRRPTLKQSAALDEDPRYTGKRVLRKDAEDSGDEFSDTELPGDSKRGFKLSGAEAESDQDDDSNEDEQGDESDEYGNSEDSESEDHDEYSIMEAKDEEMENVDEEQLDNTFQHMSSGRSVESEIEKGKAVKNQVKLWDNLLECRIQLQKCVLPANRLPKHYKIDAFKEEGGEEFEYELKKTTHSVKKLLDKLVDLQETLVNKYSDTRNLGQKSKSKTSYSDEEITSESDQEKNDVEETMEAKPPKKKKKKKRHCEDYEETLNTNHKQYLEFRDATIQKWNDRTRLITGKTSNRDFSAFEQSTLQQIRHVLKNRTRLIQRTRLPRTVGQILGDPELIEESSQPEHDSEIFDDSDFYHQLLRELIESQTGDSQDPTVLGRRWAALQKLRTKMKRRIDTRATKGRRLRYDPHQKLVGYMAPVVSPCAWNEIAITELYNSIFGKQV